MLQRSSNHTRFYTSLILTRLKIKRPFYYFLQSECKGIYPKIWRIISTPIYIYIDTSIFPFIGKAVTHLPFQYFIMSRNIPDLLRDSKRTIKGMIQNNSAGERKRIIRNGGGCDVRVTLFYCSF